VRVIGARRNVASVGLRDIRRSHQLHDNVASSSMELAGRLGDAMPLWLAVPGTGFEVEGPVTRSTHMSVKGPVH
jgi:hypothetical protein